MANRGNIFLHKPTAIISYGARGSSTRLSQVKKKESTCLHRPPPQAAPPPSLITSLRACSLSQGPDSPEVWRVAASFVLILTFGSLAAGAGVGGGGLFVPIYGKRGCTLLPTLPPVLFAPVFCSGISQLPRSSSRRFCSCSHLSCSDSPRRRGQARSAAVQVHHPGGRHR